MSKDQKQLVDLVAAEVVRLLRRNKDDAPPGKQAEVRPPVGICTGDYSKFPELAGRLHGVKPTAAVATSSAVTGPVSTVALSGIITANQLQQAWDAVADGIATLAHDARLTPLANDLARQHPERVRRAVVGETAVVEATGAAARWIWWSDGHCAVAQSITNRRSDRFATSVSPSTASGLTDVIRDLASALKSGNACGGVLFVRSAARVMCYANRCSSIRAVVGTCGEAVEEGINELGANVLVVEYPHVGPHAMESMVDRMMSRDPIASAPTQRDLAELHRCG